MQGRNNIGIISCKYICNDDSINFFIPSNNLKKGYIRFIKLGIFFYLIGNMFCLKISGGA